jgi:hypothetical protein
MRAVLVEGQCQRDAFAATDEADSGNALLRANMVEHSDLIVGAPSAPV